MPHGFNMSKGVNGANGDLRDEYRLVAAASHPQAQKLLAFWEARPADGIVIGRDVPSRAIASVLSNLTVYEPIDGSSDLRVRLAGASIQRRFGRDVTGLLMSELFPPDEFREHLETTLANIKSGTATIIDSHLTIGAVEKMHLEVVVLPVFAPDRVRKWALVGLFYFS